MAEMQACAAEALPVAGVGGAVDALGHSMGGMVLLAFALDHPEPGRGRRNGIVTRSSPVTRFDIGFSDRTPTGFAL